MLRHAASRLLPPRRRPRLAGTRDREPLISGDAAPLDTLCACSRRRGPCHGLAHAAAAGDQRRRVHQVQVDHPPNDRAHLPHDPHRGRQLRAPTCHHQPGGQPAPSPLRLPYPSRLATLTPLALPWSRPDPATVTPWALPRSRPGPCHGHALPRSRPRRCLHMPPLLNAPSRLAVVPMSVSLRLPLTLPSPSLCLLTLTLSADPHPRSACPCQFFYAYLYGKYSRQNCPRYLRPENFQTLKVSDQPVAFFEPSCP